METIIKQINLSATKNRYINKKLSDNTFLKNNAPEYLNKMYYYSDNEFYDDNDTWGKQCVDVIVRNYLGIPSVKSKYSWASVLWYSEEVTEHMPMWLCNEDGKQIIFKNGIQHIIEDNISKPYTGNCFFYLRYKNLLKEYFWIINNFIHSCTFYRICKDRYKVEKNIKFNDRTENIDFPFFYNYEINIYDELPNIDTVQERINEIICVTQYKEEITTRFKNLETMGDFIIFCNYLFNHGLHSENSGGTEFNELVNTDVKFLTPYVTVPLIFTRNTVDLGIFTPVVEQWIPKKKYYLGDVVFYNGNTYMLNRATEYEISYVDYNIFQALYRARTTNPDKTTNKDYSKNYIIVSTVKNIKEFVYNKLTFDDNRDNVSIMMGGKTNVYVYSNNNKYGIVLPYHCGVYDEKTRLTIFVEQKENGNNTDGFWRKIEYPYFLKYNDFNSQSYTGITESRIIDFKRKKQSVDDSGNILPFIVHYDNNGVLTTDTELQFKPGIIRAIKADDGTTITDGISSINLYTDETATRPIKSFYRPLNILYSQIPNNANVIEFTYYLGRRIDGNNDNPIEQGLTYKEKYWFTHDTLSGVNIDNLSDLSFDFANINLSYSLLNVETNTDVELLTNNPIYSNIMVDGKAMKDDGCNFAPIIKNEALIGVENISNDIDAKITRGISAAFERHHILGEIKTIQDMENFRNNYFEI